MNIELTNKEIAEIGRLRRCLNSKMIPFEEVGSFLEGLEQKINLSAAPPAPRKRKSRKLDLKDKYRLQIFGGKRA